MPLRPLTKEKKDNKQILLDLIAQQYGSSNAIIMDKAFKTQDKQIEEAMTQGGITAEQIGQSKGIDLNLLNTLMQNQENSQNKTGLEQIPQFLPAKGITSPAQIVNGNIQEGGALSWIGGRSTGDLLKKLIYLSQIQGQQTQTQLGQQELAGQKPLQKGEKEKLGIQETIEIQKDLIKQAYEGLLKPNEIFTKFETASQPFIIVRDAYARMESLQGDPSPAGDLGYIFSYMKLLDPPSTIREGEQATAANASAIPDRIRNIYNKVIRGQKLTPEQRNDFRNRATQLFKSIETQQKKTTEEFSKLAVRNNLDPRVLIRDTGLQTYIPKDISNKQNINSGTTKSGNTYRRLQ